MTGGASAGTTAGVIEKNVEMLGHVEEGHGLSMMPVGQRAVSEFDCPALGKKGDADHVIRLAILILIHVFPIAFYQ
jgi:hypothetical protein